jgi:glutamine amidotransferase
MEIAIIDYGAGNVQSLLFAFQRLGHKAELTSDAAKIQAAKKVIFPGVGEASNAMRMLTDKGLDVLIPNLTQPVLGICLGMQLLCHSSEENNTRGLGVFDVHIKRFSNAVKVPQIGWNSIFRLRSPLFEGISEAEYVYLVHSYYAPLCPNTIASSAYEMEYSAALVKDNFYGVQFHPEKSSLAGELILNNFLKL